MTFCFCDVVYVGWHSTERDADVFVAEVQRCDVGAEAGEQSLDGERVLRSQTHQDSG